MKKVEQMTCSHCNQEQDDGAQQTIFEYEAWNRVWREAQAADPSLVPMTFFDLSLVPGLPSLVHQREEFTAAVHPTESQFRPDS